MHVIGCPCRLGSYAFYGTIDSSKPFFSRRSCMFSRVFMAASMSHFVYLSAWMICGLLTISPYSDSSATIFLYSTFKLWGLSAIGTGCAICYLSSDSFLIWSLEFSNTSMLFSCIKPLIDSLKYCSHEWCWTYFLDVGPLQLVHSTDIIMHWSCQWLTRSSSFWYTASHS